MNKYELTVVLPGKATAAKKKSVTESIEKLAKILKGKVGKVDDWGVIDFAYLIKKNTQGAFLSFPLEIEASMVSQLDTKLRMEDNIIRYLIVRK